MTIKAHGFTKDVKFHIYYPSSVTIDASTNDLRPIAGWYDSDADDCNT